MEITIAEMFLGVYAVAITYLWQKEKTNYQEFHKETKLIYIALHEGRATMQVKSNEKGGKTISINHH